MISMLAIDSFITVFIDYSPESKTHFLLPSLHASFNASHLSLLLLLLLLVPCFSWILFIPIPYHRFYLLTFFQLLIIILSSYLSSPAVIGKDQSTTTI